MKRYMVKEIFLSIQGEGVRAGIPHIFVRFSGCNLDCNDETMGWRCDTDFVGGDGYELGALLDAIQRTATCDWVLLTGGEPTLQIDQLLIDVLHAAGFRIAVETNGTRHLPNGLDWVCVSPKYETPVVRTANEVKFVLAKGDPLPDTRITADHYLISPAFEPCDHDGDCERPACDGYYLNPETLAWCIQLVLDNPDWRLSCQQHHWWGIR